MFDTLPRLTSRIARRLRPRRPQNAVAHTASVVAAGLTTILTKSRLATETNPASEWVQSAVGIDAWAVAVPIAVGLMLYLADLLPWNSSRVKWAIAGVLSVDALGNVAATAIAGLPHPTIIEAHLSSIVLAILVAAVVYWSPEIITASDVSSPDRDEVLSIALSFLMVASMVGGVAFVGTQPSDPSQSGIASATDKDDQEWNKTFPRSTDAQAPDTKRGGVFVGIEEDSNSDAPIHRVDKDGNVDWTYTVSGSSEAVIINAIEYDEKTDTVLICHTAGSNRPILALDADTGAKKWEDTAVTCNGVAGQSGTAWTFDDVTNTNENLYKWDIASGSRTNVGFDTLPGDGASGGTINVGTETVIFPSYDGTNYVLNAYDKNGNHLWTELSNDDYGGSGIEGDEYIYRNIEHGGTKYKIQKVNKTSGSIVETLNHYGAADYKNGYVLSRSESNSGHTFAVLDKSDSFTEIYGTEGNIGDISGDGKTISSSNMVGYGRPGNDSLKTGIFTSKPVTVQVTDQDGNPVNDSTVQATVVDQDALNASDIYDRADQLYDEAENPEPPDFDNHLNLDTEFSETDTTYVSVHPESQMSVVEASTGGLEPDVQVASGEELYFMAWDATDEPGFLDSDLINRQLPGSPTDSTIVIEQLDHRGDTTHTRTLDTENPDALAEIGYVSILDDYSRTHASTTLPDGFYRITTEESDFEYIIAVGDPATTIENEIRDEADHLTDQAKWVQDRHNDGLFATKTGVTNETGEVVLDIPASAAAIQIQAYKGPDASTVGADTAADITMQDIRDSREAGYDEAIYLSTDPTRVDMDETDGTETVEVRKLDGPPMEDPEEWANRLEDLLNERLNASIAELESAYDDRLETVKREELERRHDDLRSIVDRAGLMERVEELLGRSLADTDTGSDAELQEDLRAMQQALGEQQSQGSSGEETSEIDSGELYTEIPFASEIDPEAISVIVHTEAGESITLPDSEYRIESNGIIDGGDMVVVDGYELPTNTAVADVEVRGVSPAGRTLRERVSAVNPKMSGNVPGIDAVDVNTMRPGPDERVGLQLRPNDADAYDSLSSVDVYGPDGQTVATTLDGERAYFDSEGEGVYTVRATYAGSDGTEFVETIRLRAGSRMISERPTVRITEGLGGPTAIVGQGLNSATIETVDGETTITVRQPGDATSAPGEIHIEAQQLDASNTITVSVVRGELEESVNAHTNVVLHTNEIGDDALVYRNGKPVTADGDTKHGEYETRENSDGVTKTVIYTYSEADGTVQMSISEDPGVVERVFFDLRVRSPVDVPLAGMLYGAVELADSVPLGPTAALQTVDMPELRESDPGEIVSGTTVTNTPGVIAT